MAKTHASIYEKVRVAPAVGGAIRRRLSAWYRDVQRDLPWRRSSDPYAIWISEVMLQQTQVKTVQPYFERFLRLFPNVGALARAPQQAVLRAWQGLGYYSRARNLHRAAQVIASQMNGRLPDDRERLRDLPGIGDYTAAAILSIAFNRAYAVVDGNVKRVLSRLFLIKTPANAGSAHRVYQDIADQLLDTHHPGDFNQAVMELGATICLARNALCAQCPLAGLCKAYSIHQVDRYPVRTAKKKIPHEYTVAAVIVKKGRVLFVQRPENGMLGALWEFAGGRVSPGESRDHACRRSVRQTTGLEVEIARPLVTVHHSYSHFNLTMDVLLCRWQAGRVRRNGPQAHRWLPAGRMRQLPLHGAVLKALPMVETVLLEKEPDVLHNG